LNVIEFTADLIFSTITSASSVPCLPLSHRTLGALPGRSFGAKVSGPLHATPWQISGRASTRQLG
jgi:hypothetical protein